MNNNDLLKPSLGSDPIKTKLFSEQALFFTAFFGTAFAVCIMSAVNSYRLKRLKKDFWVYALGCIAFIALDYFLIIYALTSDSQFRGNDLRLTVRIASIAIWFIFFSIHKKTHRVNLFISDGDASPWIMGISSIVIGIAAQTMLVKFLLSFISQG